MHKEGYVMLVSVLVLTVVGSVIALSTMTLGIMSSQNNDVSVFGTQSRSIAQACAELALQEIRDNNTFVGSNVETIATGSCEYTVTNLGGENRRVDVESNVNGYLYRLEVLMDQLNPTINVILWQEIN